MPMTNRTGLNNLSTYIAQLNSPIHIDCNIYSSNSV